jgi:hypothetical protein
MMMIKLSELPDFLQDRVRSNKYYDSISMICPLCQSNVIQIDFLDDVIHDCAGNVVQIDAMPQMCPTCAKMAILQLYPEDFKCAEDICQPIGQIRDLWAIARARGEKQ